MRVRDEIRLAIGALLIVQVITSFGAIFLLSRMSPAIERILEENVYSISAVEDMLAVLALDPSDGAASEPKFTDALDRAQDNVTEDSEVPRLQAIEKAVTQDLSAQPTRRTLVGALEDLGEINLQSMRESDVYAKRLGTAGAWAAVFLGMLGFILSVLAVRRLSHRILEPLEEVNATVQAHAAGNVHRRCRVSDAPQELREVGQTMNEFIDRQAERGEEYRKHADDVVRAAALYFMDRQEGAVFLFDLSGNLVATNKKAADMLADGPTDELRTTLSAYASEPSSAPDGVRVHTARELARFVTVEPS